MTYQDGWPANPDDQDDNDDLAKQEPSNTSHRHDSPPKHGRGVITCLLISREWVEEKYIAKHEEDE